MVIIKINIFVQRWGRLTIIVVERDRGVSMNEFNINAVTI